MITNNLITGERQSGAGGDFTDNLDTVSREARGNWITVTKTIDNMMITICTHEWKVTKIFTYLHNGEDDDVCGR